MSTYTLIPDTLVNNWFFYNQNTYKGFRFEPNETLNITWSFKNLKLLYQYAGYIGTLTLKWSFLDQDMFHNKVLVPETLNHTHTFKSSLFKRTYVLIPEKLNLKWSFNTQVIDYTPSNLTNIHKLTVRFERSPQIEYEAYPTISYEE